MNVDLADEVVNASGVTVAPAHSIVSGLKLQGNLGEAIVSSSFWEVVNPAKTCQ